MILETGPVATPIPGLWLDGVFQANFEPAGAGRHRNESLDVVIESVAPAAVAVTWSSRDQKLHDFRLRIKSDDETEYYGTGERFQPLNQRGYILPMRGDDRFGNKGVGSHKPVPFLISSKGFGVWLDAFAPGAFDLGGSERFNTDLRFSDTSLRVVFIGGPSMAKVLENWTALTGRSPVPPPWAFGLWKSRDVHRNREEVLEDVEKLRRFGIPASVIVLDSPWETGYNDFEINREQFLDPDAMLGRIENLGFNLALWLTPFINSKNKIDMHGITESTSTFAEAAPHLVHEGHGDVVLVEWWKGMGGAIDFTDPKAKEWWFSQLRKTKRYGARAFKCDDGEGNFVPEAVFHDGTPASKMKNRYSILYDAAVQEYVDRELAGDGVVIVRSGYTLHAQNGETPEDLQRFRVEVAGAEIRRHVDLHEWAERCELAPAELFPYLYDAVHETARTGMPVIRPMVLAFPEDREARKQIHEFLFGPDLLVAPMYQRGTRRSVYLPQGTWFDYWSGARHSGPKSLDVEAPLDRIPLFVRPGAIIPMLPPDVMTLVPRHPRVEPNIVSMDSRRIIQLFPGTSGERTTWDGLTVKLEKSSVRVSSNSPRAVEVRLVNTTIAKIERLDGERVIPLP